MVRRSVKLTAITLLAIVLSSAWLGTAQAHDITILRGVSADTNNGKASLSPGQFVFTDDPPTLSLFDTTANAKAAGVSKPCYLHVVVDMPNQPPVKNDVGTIATKDHVYNVRFDDEPTGHWSVLLEDRDLEAAKSDFSTYAKDNKIFTNGFGLKEGVDCK